MAFKKTFRRSRRATRRPSRRQAIKRWAGEKPSVIEKIARYAGPIGTIAKTVGGIMHMVNCEAKYVDNASAVTTIPTTGTFVATYTTMPQGLGDQARNGNSIKGKGINAKMLLFKNSSVASSTVRLMWVLDKECDGALPSITNILDNVDVVSGLNKDFSKRFVVLKDKVITLSDGAGTNRYYKQYIPTDFHVHFDGASSAITDAKENQVYLIAIGDQLTALPNILHWGRFTYYDN